DNNPFVTCLCEVTTVGAYVDAIKGISFLNQFCGGAAGSEAETFMIEHLEKNGHVADLFSPDGFAAAQMIVEAIRTGGGDDVDSMIAALEGYTFEGVKGTMTIRAEDHALLQPMFQAKLVAQGNTFVPELIAIVPADQVAP